MRRLLLVCALLGACGGPPAKRPAQPTAEKVPGAVVEKGIPFVPCSERPCVFHKGSNEHRECLNGDNRACFLFGKICKPATAKK